MHLSSTSDSRKGSSKVLYCLFINPWGHLCWCFLLPCVDWICCLGLLNSARRDTFGVSRRARLRGAICLFLGTLALAWFPSLWKGSFVEFSFSPPSFPARPLLAVLSALWRWRTVSVALAPGFWWQIRCPPSWAAVCVPHLPLVLYVLSLAWAFVGLKWRGEMCISEFILHGVTGCQGQCFPSAWEDFPAFLRILVLRASAVWIFVCRPQAPVYFVDFLSLSPDYS